jgi:hypothetical protein
MTKDSMANFAEGDVGPAASFLASDDANFAPVSRPAATAAAA